jgi:hypothetical protein
MSETRTRPLGLAWSFLKPGPEATDTHDPEIIAWVTTPGDVHLR